MAATCAGHRLIEATRASARPAPRSAVGVLLIEQFTHIELQIADAAYVMERGKICFSGEPRALVDNPDILHSAYLA